MGKYDEKKIPEVLKIKLINTFQGFYFYKIILQVQIKLEYKLQPRFLLFLRESERGEPQLNRSKDCPQLLARRCLFRIGFQLFLLERR